MDLEADFAYRQDDITFSPCDVGVPSSRERLYSRYNLTGFTLADTGLGLSFAGLFFRDSLICGDVYLCAPESVITSEHALRSIRKGGPASASASSDSGNRGKLEDICSPSNCGRLENWLVLAQKKNIMSSDGKKQWAEDVRMCIANVTQNEGYGHLNTEVMPALLRRSLLVDLVRERPVAVAEMWLIQGFPHPDIDQLPLEVRARFPFPKLVSNTRDASSHLPLSKQIEMVGNSMHLSQIGLWVLYNIATTTFVAY